MEWARLCKAVAMFAGVFCVTTGIARSQSSERVLPTWVEVHDGAWRVQPELVREMAQRLQEGPTHADLRNMTPLYQPAVRVEDYTVQYRGELLEGARLVRLAGDCHGHHKSDEVLGQGFLHMMDGGPCIFDATYSPADHRFTVFAFHAKR